MTVKSPSSLLGMGVIFTFYKPELKNYDNIFHKFSKSFKIFAQFTQKLRAKLYIMPPGKTLTFFR